MKLLLSNAYTLVDKISRYVWKFGMTKETTKMMQWLSKRSDIAPRTIKNILQNSFLIYYRATHAGFLNSLVFISLFYIVLIFLPRSFYSHRGKKVSLEL